MCRFCICEALLQIKEYIDRRCSGVEARLDIMLIELLKELGKQNDRRKM